MNPTNNKPTAINDSRICRHRTRTGRRCRLPVSENSALCFRHAALRQTHSVDADLASAFPQLSEFRSAVVINEFLSKLLALLVQDRISTKRAAVLAYITNQLLRTLPAIDAELNPKDDEPHTIIYDAPRPDYDLPAPETQVPCQADEPKKPAEGPRIPFGLG
jgi:hypothetical protein